MPSDSQETLSHFVRACAAPSKPYAAPKMKARPSDMSQKAANTHLSML